MRQHQWMPMPSLLLLLLLLLGRKATAVHKRKERRRQHVPKGVSVEVKELPAGLVLVLVIFDQLYNMGNKIHIFVRPTFEHFWVLVAFPVIGSCCIGAAAQKGGEEILQTVGA